MGIYTNTRSAFPSQVVSDQEKASIEYGKQVAQAIEGEWFSQGRTTGNRYITNWNNFNQLRHKYLKISDFNNGKKFINKVSDYKNIDILNIHT